MTHDFEADLVPDTGQPRVRFNLANGWSVSVVLMMRDDEATTCMLASVACCPTGYWGTGITENLGTELSADEVAQQLAAIAARPALVADGEAFDD